MSSFFIFAVSDSTSLQRLVGKTNFSIWRHSVEQVYLGYTQNKSCTHYACLSSREGGVRKGVFLFTL